MAQIRSQIKKSQRKRTEKTLAKARTRDSMTAFSKLTQMVDGEPQIVADPPLIERVEATWRHGREGEAVIEALHAAAATVPSVASDRSADPFGGVSAGRPRPQGGRCRERRHPCLDCADARPRRDRSALPAVQGGTVVGARGVHRQERVRQSRRACRRRPAPDAGLERHLPGLAACRGRYRRSGSRLLRSPAEGLERVIRDGGGAAPGHGRLRSGVRLDARPRACPFGRSDRDRLLPRRQRCRSTAPSQISPQPTPTRTNATTPRSKRQ